MQHDFISYPWSSWKSLLSEAPTHLLRNEVLEWFGGKPEFVRTHKEMAKYYENSEVGIEDE